MSSKSESSKKMLSVTWFIYYDPKSRCIQLGNNRKSKKNDRDRFVAHELNMADLCKLSTKDRKLRSLQNVYSSLREKVISKFDEKIMCVGCKKFVHGVCAKHPLIFVHEKIPENVHYTCNETFPPFFQLLPSVIPEAGKGVFTMVDLPAGLSFGPYSGNLENSVNAESSGYSWRIRKNGALIGWADANSLFYSNWMRYVNCPRNEEEQNMLAVLLNGAIFYVTYAPIKAGSELMVWYGNQYAMHLGIPNLENHTGILAPKTNPNKRWSVKTLIDSLKKKSTQLVNS